LGVYDAPMPTKNPRITVTLTPELHAVMRRMSELTGNSQSAIIGELLNTSMPVFERMVKVMEAALSARDKMSADVAISLLGAQTKIEEQMGLVLDAFDEGSKPILQAAEKIQRKARRVSSTPVPVTRGSGPYELPKSSRKAS
jgi:hypothetical protein